MKTIYTIGFSKKSLEDFVSLLRASNITKIIDIRLKPNSQFSGFAKGRDLEFLLKEFLGVDYEYIRDLAPTEELLERYRRDKDWEAYEREFKKIIKNRKIEPHIQKILDENQNVCLLCMEKRPTKCHRRLVAELVKERSSNIEIKHII